MSIEKTEKKTEAVKEAQPVTETTGAAAYCGPTVKGIARSTPYSWMACPKS